jgi:hypothetical protein
VEVHPPAGSVKEGGLFVGPARLKRQPLWLLTPRGTALSWHRIGTSPVPVLAAGGFWTSEPDARITVVWTNHWIQGESTGAVHCVERATDADLWIMHAPYWWDAFSMTAEGVKGWTNCFVETEGYRRIRTTPKGVIRFFEQSFDGQPWFEPQSNAVGALNEYIGFLLEADAWWMLEARLPIVFHL